MWVWGKERWYKTKTKLSRVQNTWRPILVKYFGGVSKYNWKVLSVIFILLCFFKCAYIGIHIYSEKGMGIRFTSNCSEENKLEECMPRTITVIRVKDGNLCKKKKSILSYSFFLSYKVYMIIKSTHPKQKYWDIALKHIYVSYIK